MATATRRIVSYHEVQRFGQWWLWIVVLGIAALQWYSFIEQIVLGRPFGDNPAPDWLLIPLVLLFGIGLPWLFAASRLVTVVRPEALYVQLFPFHLKPVVIRWDSIAACSGGKYNPILDYGGWGIRLGRDGRAYNVSGNLGVKLELKQGRSLLIGTRHPVELAAAINAMLKSS